MTAGKTVEKPTTTTTVVEAKKPQPTFDPNKTVHDLAEQLRAMAGDRHKKNYDALAGYAKLKFDKESKGDLKIPLNLLKEPKLELVTIANVIMYLDISGHGSKPLNQILVEQGLGKLPGPLAFTRFGSKTTAQGKARAAGQVKAEVSVVPVEEPKKGVLPKFFGKKKNKEEKTPV